MLRVEPGLFYSINPFQCDAVAITDQRVLFKRFYFWVDVCLACRLVALIGAMKREVVVLDAGDQHSPPSMLLPVRRSNPK